LLHKLVYEYSPPESFNRATTPIEYDFSYPVGTNLSAIDMASPTMLLKRSGLVVRSPGGSQGYLLVQHGKLRWIPNMDTFYFLGLSLGTVVYTSDEFINNAPKGPPIPACSNCRRR